MPKWLLWSSKDRTDVEFVYRLLSPFGMSRVRLEKDLDPFFSAADPAVYPPVAICRSRMPIPLFLQSDTHAMLSEVPPVTQLTAASRLSPH